ncbi:hypothetical protein CEXT_11671 [Caerostris extrusa]|uniref:Uncharacterized protein n=1 Tax=Caerostris extrusa TaxID=172846 RepID=A0AAV4TU13_CAEEX|nr:hypothetical protein CEXT_11671 [Caerostris extrusa]
MAPTFPTSALELKEPVAASLMSYRRTKTNQYKLVDVNFDRSPFFCAALVAVSAYAPLVNTGVSAVSNQQDAYGNYAYRYDIKDAATGSLNSKAEVGKVGAIAVAAPVAYGGALV